MTGVAATVAFHFKHAAFSMREQFTDLASGVAGYLMMPLFIFILGKVWERFNSYQGNYTFHEILLYVGMTEALFLTFLRYSSWGRASADFSLSLARPRSWLAFSFSGIFGWVFGGRLLYCVLIFAIMPVFGISPLHTSGVMLRFFCFLPGLTVIAALYSMIFASAKVVWDQTSYFSLPISKIFLSLGGVFGPLADFSQPWKRLLLALPASDIFFQPVHYCLRGRFYALTESEWAVRILLQTAGLVILNLCFFRYARKHHQSYGG